MYSIVWLPVLVCYYTAYLDVIAAVAAPKILTQPHSPTKVLAAAVSERLRYYSFSHEQETHEGHPDHGSRHQEGPGTSNSERYSTGDPFEVPSLTDIAEIMRRKDSESQGQRSHEHHDKGGWGWPQSTRPPTTRPPTKGWGWSHIETTTWAPFAPYPAHGSSYERPTSSHGGSQYGLDSYGSARQDDSSHFWSYGWPTTTTKPKYMPNYLSSDEEKYKPIRYPSSSVIGSKGSSSGYGRPSSSLWSSVTANQLGGYGQGSYGSSWPSSSYTTQRPLYWGAAAGYSKGDQRPPYHPQSQEHHRPSVESNWGYPPSPSWSDRDYSNSGWGWSKPELTRPPRPPPTTHGWSWPKPEPTRPPRPTTTPGWGWSHESSHNSQKQDVSHETSPFEYTPGKDDLTKHIVPFDTYERPDYPPGISSKGPEDSSSYNSFENSEFPSQPNHFRFVAYTPSPEEQLKIFQTVGGGGNDKGHGPPPPFGNIKGQSSPPSYGNNKGQGPPLSHGNSKGQRPPPPYVSSQAQRPPPSRGTSKGQGPPPPYNNNKGQGPPPAPSNSKGQGPPPPQGNTKGQGPPPPQGNTKGASPGSGGETIENYDRWFTNNFQRTRIRTTTGQPSHRSRQKVSSTTKPSSYKGEDSSNYQAKKPTTTYVTYNLPPRKSESLDESTVTKGTDGKSSSKSPRYDEHGFKYIPFNHPMSRNRATSQRDIYDNLDYTNGDGSLRGEAEKFGETSESRHWAHTQGSWRGYDHNVFDPRSYDRQMEEGNTDALVREALDQRLESAAIDPENKNSNPCPLGQIYSKLHGQCEEPGNNEEPGTTMKSVIQLFK